MSLIFIQFPIYHFKTLTTWQLFIFFSISPRQQASKVLNKNTQEKKLLRQNF